MPAGPRIHPSPPSFFLAEGSSAEHPRLDPADERHAVRALRVEAGDLLTGLDGRGQRFPLRIVAVQREDLALELAGAVETTPMAGEEGAELPWVELAVSWPRRPRVEDMLGRLVQLGAASIRPLQTQQRGPEDPPAEASERMQRVAREACKQCGRAWLPVFEPRATVQELAEKHAGVDVAVLDPSASLPFDTWLRSLRPSPVGPGSRARPIVIVVGPEGGLTDEERTVLLQRGASRTWIGPHVLRVETAAEASMAVAAVVLGRPDPGR